jgi:hypothetical protein
VETNRNLKFFQYSYSNKNIEFDILKKKNNCKNHNGF